MYSNKWLFQSLRDFQLNKRTFVNLRWIALLGQLLTIVVVKFVLKFEFDFLYCILIVAIGIFTNLYLQFKTTQNPLNNFYSTTYLAYDIFQLGCLLYLTGGITNPFIFLLIIPSVFSSTYLTLGSTIFLGLLTTLFVVILTFFYLPLPHDENFHFHVPDYYLNTVPISVLIGLVFLIYFGFKFGAANKARKQALDNIHTIMAKEHELVSLGGQAAAAAHSLGTPLSTISLVIKEIKKELKNKSEFSKFLPQLEKDIDLLISQSDRCNQILKKLSLNPGIEDEFLSSEVTFFDHLDEIIKSFQDISDKEFFLNIQKNKFPVKFRRSIEINYGLRNFIGNANKFSKQKINIILISDKIKTTINITDDGPGFPSDVLDKLGEPYIKSSSEAIRSKTGLGLGTFIGKTLLEKNFGNVIFEQFPKSKGATVSVEWFNDDLKKI